MSRHRARLPGRRVVAVAGLRPGGRGDHGPAARRARRRPRRARDGRRLGRLPGGRRPADRLHRGDRDARPVRPAVGADPPQLARCRRPRAGARGDQADRRAGGHRGRGGALAAVASSRVRPDRRSASTPPAPSPWWPPASGRWPGRSSPGRSRGRARAYTDTMAAWRVGGEITPFKPWLGMSQWAFRDFDGGNVYGPVALAALATAIVVLTCGPWATRLGPELRLWCLAYPAYLAVVLDPFTSIFRYAIPLFPLMALVVAGGWRAPDWLETRARWLWTRAGVLVAIGIGGQALWIWKLLVYRPAVGLPAVTVTGLRAVVTSQGRSAVGQVGAAPPGRLPARRVCRDAGPRVRRDVGGGDVVPDAGRGGSPRPVRRRHPRRLGQHLVRADRHAGLSGARCRRTRTPDCSPTARGRSTRPSR